MIEYTTKYNVKTTMYQQFENSVKERGDHPCLYYYHNTLSWNETSDMIDKCAAALAANGVKKGDRVVICLPNMPQCVAAVYAVNKIGAVASMLHPLSVKSEADYTINLVGAKYAFCFDVSEKAFAENPDLTVIKCRTAQYFPKSLFGVAANLTYKKKIKGKTAPATNVKKLIDFADFIKEGEAYISENGVPETADDPQATAAIMMTGGTTGNPKGVMLTSEAINNLSYELVDVVEQVMNMKVDQDHDGMLTALPVFHGFGFALCMHVSMCVGMAQALFPAFDAKMCSDAVKKYHLNYIFGVPDFFEKVYKAGYLKGVDMSTMKLIGSGGDVVPYSLTEKMDRLLKENGARVHFVSGYGLTECVTVCTFTDPRREAPQGCIGVPCYNVEAMTVKPGTTEKCEGEDGELCIYAPTLMQGYWNDPEEKAKILQDPELDPRIRQNPSLLDVTSSGTCVSASFESHLARRHPAEFARWAQEITSPKESISFNVNASAFNPSYLEAYNILRNMFEIKPQSIDFNSKDFTFSLSPDKNAKIRAQIQNKHWDKGERNILDVFMQSTLMHAGSEQTYNTLIDKREGKFNSNPI